MSKESTKEYQVRLIKGFPMPSGHRRAGYHFIPGPEPQTVELTEEQVKLIELDPSLEFVNEDQKPEAEQAKTRRRRGSQPEDQKPEAEQAGRNYDDESPAATK